jgi:succinyl-CoA:acetate CoA-transferase
VGNIANAVLGGLRDGGFTNLTAFTEVIQDGMLDLIRTDTIRMASATALSLSPEGVEEFARNIDHYRERIVLRPQEISNHAELVRRLGCIGINGMVEADLYGNVNSTHVAGTSIINGIGGSGDFAVLASCPGRHPVHAKNGAICIALSGRMSTHRARCLHRRAGQGLADLRGLSPKQRAQRDCQLCPPGLPPAVAGLLRPRLPRQQGKHTPHLLGEALSWHQRTAGTGQHAALSWPVLAICRTYYPMKAKALAICRRLFYWQRSGRYSSTTCLLRKAWVMASPMRVASVASARLSVSGWSCSTASTKCWASLTKASAKRW